MGILTTDPAGTTCYPCADQTMAWAQATSSADSSPLNFAYPSWTDGMIVLDSDAFCTDFDKDDAKVPTLWGKGLLTGDLLSDCSRWPCA